MTSSSPSVGAAPSASTSSRPASLLGLLGEGATYPAISAYLDGLSSYTRLDQVQSVTGGQVGKLYRAVSDGPPMKLAEFFPASIEDGQTVILEGRNSLPAFTRFQKRFCRKNGVIVGYNHQTMAFATGPGYFVIKDGDASHPDEILFDYTADPPFLPDGWPPFKPNGAGLSRLVYHHMKDYCRRVATGVVVGAAFKQGVAQTAWFTLTRV